jgi:GDP-L-fucose synthase
MNLDKATYEANTSPMCSHINVGSGSDVTIADLAKTVASTTGYQGNITFDTSKPDGAPRKWMDSSKLNTLGWRPAVNLEAGLAHAYKEFTQNAR